MNHSSGKQNGFSLVELLVALAIGALLIFGATQAYVDSRNAYAINETVSRMQETARYAMSVMEPDLRMSNYWGLIKGAETITGKVSQATAQSGLGGAVASKCGKNFPLDLEYNLQGTEGTYSATCAPLNNHAMPNADTITVRRASAIADILPLAVTSGPLRICSTRASGALVTDTASAACDGAKAATPTGQINDLMVNLYYVDTDSDLQNGVPSLRRYSLDTTPALTDGEIVPGVEDMQIQYGVDRSGGRGPTAGAASQYLDAGATLNALLNDPVTPAQIVSVRIWLLIRSDTPEVGFEDDHVYEYGSRLKSNGMTGDLTSVAGTDGTSAYKPQLSADNSFTSVKHYRRVLVSRTIQLRNALGT